MKYLSQSAMAFKHITSLYTAPNYSPFRYTKFFSVLTANSLPSVSLIGPPELYRPPPPPAAKPTKKSDDPFMDLMVANFNKIAAKTPSMVDNHNNLVIPPMGLTENASPTFLSSGNPCLDFFFHVVPGTPAESVNQRLHLAWAHDPLMTLKLICNLRGVKGTGKSDREGGYTAALWLHKNHPKTLALNVDSFARFGYSKDLLEILFRLLEGADARKPAQKVKKELDSWILRSKDKSEGEEKKMARYRASYYGRRLMSKESESLTRAEKRIERAKNVILRFNTDPDFKFLHDRVSDYFAKQLKSDMETLNKGDSEDLFKISLAAKWCPSLDSSYDTFTLLCETIAKRVFPRDEYPEYDGVEEAHYAYRVRDRLRKQVLVPLRKALELPEIYMDNDWGSIPYHRVASVAMKIHKDQFSKHDSERFNEYLEKVEKGEAKIAAGALLPHSIIASLDDKVGGKVAELQWKRMVDDMAEKGSLNNCLAICDVSGSMEGEPMDVSVALGILVSELSEEPWKGKLITFSEKPELQNVVGTSLKEKTRFVKKMDWMMNTDFQKVFDLILQVAVEGKLKPEEMIKRLFVFSDMEFDQASLHPWETDYQAIVRKFKEKGYGDCVPEIVFWNLRDSKATPVPSNQAGVALVSGYSKNLMTLFLDKGGIIDPVAVMEEAISRKEYEDLKVFD
ncbi:hypothetical protein CASFOL_032330 [Castilleja foliolosa]|uniref:DUF2828 domain-containing protein n=1 Tax=Castilleja foliolosa TaxID=1961234 RepID=A0ABD3C2H1_9LAMI